MGRTCCVQKLFRTISVHNMFSPCSAKRRASDKDLPVINKQIITSIGRIILLRSKFALLLLAFSQGGSGVIQFSSGRVLQHISCQFVTHVKLKSVTTGPVTQKKPKIKANRQIYTLKYCSVIQFSYGRVLQHKSCQFVTHVQLKSMTTGPVTRK